MATIDDEDNAATVEPDIVIGSREQLFHLLAEAAEIEHTLMCSYLFAAFSLRDERDETFTPDQAETVGRWTKAIMGVAIQEMGHLLIVSNMISAIGGRPHFSRPNFPVSSGYFPSGVALTLSPFSAATVRHFAFLERPTGVEMPDGEGFEATEFERTQGTAGLMPSAQDYTTVSHLYEAIRSNLDAVSERIGEAGLFIGSKHSQLGASIFKMDKVEVITDLAAAHRAIDTIIEEGEGAPADREQSHYQTFCVIERELDALLKAAPNFSPAYPVAENPVMRRHADLSDKVFIDAVPAALFLDLGNALYGLLLRCLVQTYAYGEETQADEKRELMATAVDLMHGLATVAKALVRLQASPSKPAVTAGITFTMLRGIEPFIAGDIERALVRERLTELSSGASSLARYAVELAELASTLERRAGAF